MDKKKELKELYKQVKPYFGLHDIKYKHYDILSEYIWLRDNFTCQECGFKTNTRIMTFNGCVLEPFLFDRNRFEGHPSWCPIIVHEPLYGKIEKILYKNKIIPKNPCSSCDYFTEYFYEEYEVFRIVMHHIDNNAKNNTEKNLTTLCRSCNNKKKNKTKRRQKKLKDKFKETKIEPNETFMKKPIKRSSSNVFDLWNVNNKQLPIFVRANHWAERSKFEITNIEPKEYPTGTYGKAYGYFYLNGKKQEYTELKNSGVYKWILLDD